MIFLIDLDEWNFFQFFSNQNSFWQTQNRLRKDLDFSVEINNSILLNAIHAWNSIVLHNLYFQFSWLRNKFFNTEYMKEKIDRRKMKILQKKKKKMQKKITKWFNGKKILCFNIRCFGFQFRFELWFKKLFIEFL